MSGGTRPRALLLAGWAAAGAAAVGVRLWNALAGPTMWGYDAWGHVAYVLFLDLYRAVPLADQGWSYYHPPLHYVLGLGLAQLGSGEVLMRGLALLGGAASLGTAALAAWLVRALSPGRPALALLAFGAVAFLPVHLYASPMPGNQMTETFFSAAALAVFLANERRERPRLSGDLAAGMLLGLALLTRFNALLPVAALLASLGLRALGSSRPRREIGRAVLMAGAVLALAGPNHLRNAVEVGTPLPSNSDYPLVARIESRQPPGARSWRDYVSLPLALFTKPDPEAPHLLHSVWGSVYLNAWADTHRESDVAQSPHQERAALRATSLMAVLGLVPTALAAWGALLALADTVEGRRRRLYVPLLLLTALALAAFAAFSWRIPTWAALKASYCLPLSLPFAAFLARGVEWLVARTGRGLHLALGVWLASTAGAATAIAVSGAVLPRRADAPATGAVHFHFGEYDAARAVYRRLVAGAEYKVPWLENLAAVELADGRPERAQTLQARALALGGPDPRRQGRLAVATALAGELAAARDQLDVALDARALPVLRVNRGAVRAALGDLDGAERDLRAALERDPELVPGWLDLAEVLERAGRPEEAQAARSHAARAACRAPRGYPHGVGTGEILEWGVGRRLLLLLDAEGLRPALPAFYASACARLRS